MIIARDGDPRDALSTEDQALWQRLGGKILHLGDAGGIQDLEGHYGKLLDEYRCDVLLKRPDYYIFGACRTVGDLPALMADLRRQLACAR
jgi:hypothetical protein